MDYTEKTLRHVNAYQGIIVDVQVDMIKLPNDNITMREVVHHPGGVCVAAIDQDGQVTVVRQYRYPFGQHLLELPAGKLERGEEPLPAAKRELSEETGLEADTWIDLGAIYTSPGFSTETLYLYLAQDLHQGKSHPDPGEFLDVDKIPLSQLVDMVENGMVQDAKTVVGALRAERYFHKN
jgi:ADP-ribose pyrophosphatase